MKKLYFILIVVAVTFIALGCNGFTPAANESTPPAEHDSRLVDTFERTNTQATVTTTVTYVFNSDGTGSMTADVNGSVNGPNALEWRTYNGILYRTIAGDPEEYGDTYSIDFSNNLVYGAYTYIRQ